MLGKLMNTYHVQSPILNGNSAPECFERGNAMEIHNGIMFNFYPGLPHMTFLLANIRTEQILDFNSSSEDASCMGETVEQN